MSESKGLKQSLCIQASRATSGIPVNTHTHNIGFWLGFSCSNWTIVSDSDMGMLWILLQFSCLTVMATVETESILGDPDVRWEVVEGDVDMF